MTDPELFQSVTEAIRACSPAAREIVIESNSRLFEDLSLDSLDLVAVLMQLQDAHEIELDLDAVPDFRHVSDLMAELGRQLRSKAAA
ncbi:acyl carrier protein [Tautonia marina]|uniref:acyl carrier protein n=1 Tax=Tautonia marina TaxID=2653855 RepID=UPI00191C3CDF|nr:phosphopantetheine-binding protein [Tautonia marina]